MKLIRKTIKADNQNRNIFLKYYIADLQPHVVLLMLIVFSSTSNNCFFHNIRVHTIFSLLKPFFVVVVDKIHAKSLQDLFQ